MNGPTSSEIPVGMTATINMAQLSDKALTNGLHTFQEAARARGLSIEPPAAEYYEDPAPYPEIADKRLNAAYVGYVAVLDSLRAVGGGHGGDLEAIGAEDFILEYKNWQKQDMTYYMAKTKAHRKNEGLSYKLIATPNVTVTATDLLGLLRDIGSNHAGGTEIDLHNKHGWLMRKYGSQELSGTSPWDRRPALFKYVPSQPIGKPKVLKAQRRAMARLAGDPVTPTSMLDVATYLKTLALQQPGGKIASQQARHMSSFFLTSMGKIEMDDGEYIPFVQVVKDGYLFVSHANVLSDDICLRPAVGQRPPKQRRAYLEPWRALFSKQTWNAIVGSFAGPDGPGPG